MSFIFFFFNDTATTEIYTLSLHDALPIYYDEINDIDNDENGDLYFAGHTFSAGFPASSSITVGPSFTTRATMGSHHPLGEPKWITIYGYKVDLAHSIATDKLGNVYVAGLAGQSMSQNLFPVSPPQAGAYNKSPVNGNVNYAFLIKLNQNNGIRTWATVYGDDANASIYYANAVATDNVGNVYIGGIGQNKSNFPIVNGSGTAHIQTNTNINCGFLAMFDATNNALQWSTMFGNDNLSIRDMNVNNNNELYIVGETSGIDTALFFQTTEFRFDTLADRLRELAYLNRELTIVIEDKRDPDDVLREEYQFDGGIIEFVDYLDETRTPIHQQTIYISDEDAEVPVELALRYNTGYTETVLTFVNNINTTEFTCNCSIVLWCNS